MDPAVAANPTANPIEPTCNPRRTWAVNPIVHANALRASNCEDKVAGTPSAISPAVRRTKRKFVYPSTNSPTFQTSWPCSTRFCAYRSEM